MDTSELRRFLTDLYRHYRTARMNRLYYGWRLDRLKRWNRVFEIAIALFGGSSALAGWRLWGSEMGSVVWGILAGIATLLSVLKPILRHSQEIERYSRLYTGHGDVYYDLRQVVETAIRCHGVPDGLRLLHDSALERIKKLAVEDDPDPDPRLLRRAFDQVNRENPPGPLWLPEETSK